MKDLNEKNLNKKSKLSKGLIILIAFIILTLLELFIYLPKIKLAIKKSNVTELINSSKKEEEKSQYRDVQLFYISPLGKLENFPTKIKISYDTLHDTFENELNYPPYEVLKDFFVTYIPESTKLIGASQTTDSIYINVSKDFLNSKDKEAAYRQLEATAKAINQKAAFILLIEGEEFSTD